MKYLEYKKNYFFITFFSILLSIGAFYIFKALLPESLFAKTAQEQSELLTIAELELTEADIDDASETGYAVFDGLINFFQKLFTLEKTKKGSVRIAYFGDSMIECDQIVQDIRKSYQNKFGGQGIGFVPLSSLSPHFNGSIRYEYSPEWDTYCDFCLKKLPASALGISGFVSFANANTSIWTSYRNGLLSLAKSTLFYGQSDNSNAIMTITTDNGTIDSVLLKPTGILNKHSLASWTRELKLQFDNADSIPFYGVNFSGGSGVNVDDFALRGNSGLPLGSYNMALMNAFQRELDYDLIVLQFGANVLALKPFDWYANKMTRVVNHLKKCFPGADILIISQADKATKYGAEMKTDTNLAALIQAQEKYARNTGAAFIDLFQLMGGEGSMAKWASETPPLARSDYIHFNEKGAKRIGNLIFEKLDREYENFKIKNNLLY